MKKTIFENNGYEKTLRLILMGVAGDSAKVKMVDSAGGDVWESKCEEVENTYGRFNVTIFKKNGKVVGKDVYSYDTETATEFVYDRLEKTYTKVEEVN